MAKTIMVDPDGLVSVAANIALQSEEYERQYKLLFNEIEAMGAAWKGNDNMEFVNQIKSFMEDFQQMSTLLKQYSDFLSKSSKAYVQVQNDTINAAKRLTN